MSGHFFPDNTVLCNFASVHQLSLLQRLLDGKGRWTEAVAFEADRSSAYYTDLGSIPSDGWLGDPIEIEEEGDVRQVEGIRTAVFGGKAAESLAHLGEAQTIFVITRWDAYQGSTWISDDQESLRYARLKFVPVRETQHLIAEAVQLGWLTSAAGFAMLEQMIAEGQSPVLPAKAADLLSL